MPSPPVPKRWKAAARFTYRRQRYEPGDPVTDPHTIGRLAGSTLIQPVRPDKPAPAEPEPEPEEIPDGS